MHIITPIRPRSQEEFETLIKQINGRADIVEVWLDQVLHLSSDFSKVRTQTLGVCKTPREGGNFTGTPKERAKMLQTFLDAGGDFVDLDIIHNPTSILSRISGTSASLQQHFPAQAGLPLRSSNTSQLVLSFHDFKTVPDDLDKIFHQMRTFDPHVYKFAVTTNGKPELQRFLRFVEKFPDELNLLATTMGDLGREGREEIGKGGKCWGEFRALDEDHRTARGQKTLDE